MTLLTDAEARQVIENFKTQLRVNSKRYGKRPKNDYCGGAVGAVNVLTDAIARYGSRMVGSVLEEARSHLSIDEPWFYYEGGAVTDAQDAEIDAFDNAISKLVDALLQELQNQEEPEEKPKKPTKEELKREYRKTRRQLQQLIRRRAKKGINVSDFGIKVPSIPKRITAGSIRRLVREIEKVKRKVR